MNLYCISITLYKYCTMFGVIVYSITYNNIILNNFVVIINILKVL